MTATRLMDRMIAQIQTARGSPAVASRIMSLPMKPESGGSPAMAIAAVKKSPATSAPPAIGGASV